MGGKKKYIEMFGSFMEPFNYHTSQQDNAVKLIICNVQQVNVRRGKKLRNYQCWFKVLQKD